jgi:hypothetical protein
MANLTVTAATVHEAKAPLEQFTAPAAVAVTAGQMVAIDSNGKWFLALATTAANAGRRRGMAVKTVAAGESLTAIIRGLVDVPGALDALAFDAQVFLSDTAGTMADAAGTVSTVIGTVMPGWASGASADRLLLLNN